MQMIGSGLRGLDAGGTKYANMVDFHDTWDKFNFWLDHKKLLVDEFGEDIKVINGVSQVKTTDANSEDAIKYDPHTLWDIYLKIYNAYGS